MKQIIKRFLMRCDGGVRRFCSGLPPRRRMTIILVLFTVFLIVNIAIIVRDVNDIKDDNKRQEIMKIEHVKKLELEKRNRVPELINKLIEEEDEQYEK